MFSPSPCGGGRERLQVPFLDPPPDAPRTGVLEDTEFLVAGHVGASERSSAPQSQALSAEQDPASP